MSAEDADRGREWLEEIVGEKGRGGLGGDNEGGKSSCRADEICI